MILKNKIFIYSIRSDIFNYWIKKFTCFWSFNN